MRSPFGLKIWYQTYFTFSSSSGDWPSNPVQSFPLQTPTTFCSICPRAFDLVSFRECDALSTSVIVTSLTLGTKKLNHQLLPSTPHCIIIGLSFDVCLCRKNPFFNCDIRETRCYFHWFVCMSFLILGHLLLNCEFETGEKTSRCIKQLLNRALPKLSCNTYSHATHSNGGNAFETCNQCVICQDNFRPGGFPGRECKSCSGLVNSQDFFRGYWIFQ